MTGETSLLLSQSVSSGANGSDNLRFASLIVAASFIIGYIFSLWYLDIYYSGDAYHYNRFYTALYQMPPLYWEGLQREHISSAEPLYRYIIGIGAFFGVDRIHYIAIWNGLLVSLAAFILQKYKSSFIFAMLFFTNYYLFVILGPAERVKFAYIFIFLAVGASSKKIKYFSLLFSVFCHTQALIQFFSSLIYYVFKERNDILARPLVAWVLALGAVLSLGFFGYLFLATASEVLISKSEEYSSNSEGVFEIIEWLLLLSIGLFIYRDKAAYFAGMLPMGIFTFLYGNRVNIASLAFFAAIALLQGKTKNPLVLGVMAYMSYKSVDFISNVLAYGTGYP